MDEPVLESGKKPPPLPVRPGWSGTSAGNPVRGFALDFLIAIAALLVLSLISGAVWALVKALQIVVQSGAALDTDELLAQLSNPDAIAIIGMTLFSTGGAALVVYFWRRRATTQERALSTSQILKWSTWGWVMAAAASTFLFSAAVTSLAQYFGMAPEPSNAALIEAAFSTHPVFLMFFAVLIAPAYEELLFRRVLFGRLWAAGRPWLGLFLSSAAFALMHEIPGTNGNTWQATGVLWLTYGFMGAVFAGVYWRTRTLWAAWAAHALNNGLALAVIGLYSRT